MSPRAARPLTTPPPPPPPPPSSDLAPRAARRPLAAASLRAALAARPQTLTDLYAQTLAALKAVPADAAYRVNVEKITHYRMQVVSASEDVDAIESALDVGQMPEIIEQAQDELDLIPYMLEWKPWQTTGSKPAVIEVTE